MGWAFWAIVCAAFALLVVSVALSVMLAAERRRSGRMLDEVAAERDQWRSRAEAGVSTSGLDGPARPPGTPVEVITSLGEERASEGRVVPDRVVLSAAFGEPLVKALAFGHGVRRALAPESRNRIRFAVRRGTKLARKDRRREMRRVWRESRATGSGRTAEGVADA